MSYLVWTDKRAAGKDWICIMSDKIAIVKSNDIQSNIFTIRSLQVMVDRDLAALYEVGTKVLNQAVKRNIERFPEKFRFQLTVEEKTELVTNCDRFLILDNKGIYHFGASLKDLGKKWFAFSKFEKGAWKVLRSIKKWIMTIVINN